MIILCQGEFKVQTEKLVRLLLCTTRTVLGKLTFKRSVTLIIYYSGDQIKKEMGRTCGTYGRQVRCIQGFGGES